VVAVRLFASLRELAGASRLEVEAADVGELLGGLSARFGPEFDRIMAAGAVIVHGEPAPRTRRLDPGDEVALLPPVSGG
jgi:MoaD family protein